ncbi:MAG: 50S ribosomal protein L24e [Candidatus Aenigmatarchaeota archaeon]
MKCSICKNNIPRGTGKMFVRNDGKIFYFCSSKCQKNWNMGRLEKGLKWAMHKGEKAEKLEKNEVK